MTTGEWNPTPMQLMCRDLLHSWEPETAWVTFEGYIRVFVCARCATQKYQSLDREGYIIKSEYHYPEGYMRPKGKRMTKRFRAELRTQNMKRWE